MARAMRASAEWNPNAILVRRRILVLVDSMSPLHPLAEELGDLAVAGHLRALISGQGEPDGLRELCERLISRMPRIRSSAVRRPGRWMSLM